MAALTAILGGLAAAGAIAGATTSIVSATKGHKETPAPTYNAKAEQEKAANQEANANRKRVMAETETVKTSALGNTGATQTQKKTLLGG